MPLPGRACDLERHGGVTDSDGASDSDNQVVVVTVANVAPVARDDAYDTNEDESL